MFRNVLKTQASHSAQTLEWIPFFGTWPLNWHLKEIFSNFVCSESCFFFYSWIISLPFPSCFFLFYDRHTETNRPFCHTTFCFSPSCASLSCRPLCPVSVSPTFTVYYPSIIYIIDSHSTINSLHWLVYRTNFTLLTQFNLSFFHRAVLTWTFP